MGHPYARARRENQAGLTFGIVNKDSGDFFAGWRQQGPEERSGGVEASAFNVSNHARYLYDPEASAFTDFGTRRMFGRNLPELVVRDVAPRFWRRSEEILWP
jgi:nicotinic acid phosphoribosyltransferase